MTTRVRQLRNQLDGRPIELEESVPTYCLGEGVYVSSFRRRSIGCAESGVVFLPRWREVAQVCCHRGGGERSSGQTPTDGLTTM